MKYTYDDIITAKDILTGRMKKEDIIGKKGWFMNGVPSDMSLNAIMRIAQKEHLESVEENKAYAFRYRDYGFIYFLPEKEESASNPRFKVGDKVLYCGKPAEICIVDNDSIFLPYLISCNGRSQWVEEEWIVPDNPEFRKNVYRKKQAEWVKANNIKEGDKVKILRKAESHEDGWNDIWVGNEVGKTGVIDVIHSDNIRVKTNTESHWYPYFVLEKIVYKPEPKPSENHIGSPDFEEIAKALKAVLYTRYVTLHEWCGNYYICGFMDKPTHNGETWLWGPGFMYKLEIDSSVHVSDKFKTPDKLIDYSKCIIDNEADKPEFGSPEYVPFDLSKEEDRRALADRWVKSNNPDIFHEFQITQFIRMNDDHQNIYVKAGSCRYTGNDLFYDYTFLDGSPVGKLKDMPF